MTDAGADVRPGRYGLPPTGPPRLVATAWLTLR